MVLVLKPAEPIFAAQQSRKAAGKVPNRNGRNVRIRDVSGAKVLQSYRAALLPGSLRFTGQSFFPQALAVFFEGLPGGSHLTHRLLGFRATFGVSGQPLLTIENPWRANCKLFAHGKITSERSKSCSKTVSPGRHLYIETPKRNLRSSDSFEAHS